MHCFLQSRWKHFNFFCMILYTFAEKKVLKADKLTGKVYMVDFQSLLGFAVKTGIYYVLKNLDELLTPWLHSRCISDLLPLLSPLSPSPWSSRTAWTRTTSETPLRTTTPGTKRRTLRTRTVALRVRWTLWIVTSSSNRHHRHLL